MIVLFFFFIIPVSSVIVIKNIISIQKIYLSKHKIGNFSKEKGLFVNQFTTFVSIRMLEKVAFKNTLLEIIYTSLEMFLLGAMLYER